MTMVTGLGTGATTDVGSDLQSVWNQVHRHGLKRLFVIGSGDNCIRGVDGDRMAVKMIST